MSGAESSAEIAARDPFATLEAWIAEARATAHGREFTESAVTATLATASPDGAPSARQVLYKGVQRGGLLFVSDYRSRKAREMEQNPRAALVFHWWALGRQVRAEGRVERCTRAESEAYFRTRPRGSQIGAWASRQSSVLAGGAAELEAAVREATARFEGRDVPCPPDWGGYLVFPTCFEFWIGRADRLHTRWELTRATPSAPWQARLLAP